jgi:hypothetical protein
MRVYQGKIYIFISNKSTETKLSNELNGSQNGAHMRSYTQNSEGKILATSILLPEGITPCLEFYLGNKSSQWKYYDP